MNNKLFAIVGTVAILASITMFFVVRWQTGAAEIVTDPEVTVTGPRVTIQQEEGYLRVFDVTFESQEQIDTLIANYSRAGASPGRLRLLDFYSSFGLEWYVRHDDSPVIRIDAGSEWEYFSRDPNIDKLRADDFVEKLKAAGVEGIVSARSVPVILCQWFSDAVRLVSEIYFTDLQVTEGSKRNREDDRYYRLFDEEESIDCSAAARAYREYYAAGVAPYPLIARVPNNFGYTDDLFGIGTAPEYLFQ